MPVLISLSFSLTIEFFFALSTCRVDKPVTSHKLCILNSQPHIHGSTMQHTFDFRLLRKNVNPVFPSVP